MAAGGVPQFASLYVGDLHPDVTEAMLYEIFNSVGQVASIRVCRDNVTRKSLGYAYVNFQSVGDAERGLDTLNYSSIRGRSCRIMWSQRDPSLRKTGAGNIYVKNLDKNIDNKALYDTFSLFGNILSCKVASDKEGKSFGYGFVHYETAEAAKQAMERVNGMQIGEKTVQVTPFAKRSERDRPVPKNYTNLYVKCFPDDWDEVKFREVFEACGSITSMAMRKDKKGRPFAFVNYATAEEASKAVETLHLTDVRNEEQTAKDAEKEVNEEEKNPDGHPSDKMYVGRAMMKSERAADLREKIPPKEKEPKVSAPAGINLYVKNLDEATDDASLRGLFESFGTITSAAAANAPDGTCKGFGFVCFASPDEATKAVTEMHLKVVKGKPLYVGLAEKREARAERLRQRYNPTGMGKGMQGCKGKDGKGKDGKGKDGGKGGMMFGGPQFPSAGMMMGGQGMSPGMGMFGGFPGMQGGMMRPQGGVPMMTGGNGMMMNKGVPGMPNAQMMGMMGKGGPNMMMGKGGPGMMMPGMMMGGKPGMVGTQQGNPMMQQQMAMMGMRPPMQPMMQMGQMPQVQQRPLQQQPAASGGSSGAPLNAAALAAAQPSLQKQMIGERLYPAIARHHPQMAGKITGMMLEMDNSELLILLESDAQLLNKIDEALRVLEQVK